ncbi:twin-arginine translocase TatA/TatE family subunit [Flavobacterium sp. I3-2]|uniref:Sec-independent protein translocase subunit TatA/TatB n=1 Tax=Flavobacterium sp. I3-2 TaxID=2748319 RepID=UPI0015A8D37D|nr:twin-arginine translocase TatA/TatE family subunit [Flavobacterium sp. I3-2]
MTSLVTYLGVVSPWQIVVILAVILLLFGGKKIPELMKGLGSGIKEFKDATKEENAKKDDSSKTDSENK